ncbi:speriolin-like protein [Colossoma macropomum]|uniref:speriolin-like protein n=1 Tax=Colossoma macropomum TaxID=42526 RepID=UPI0018655DC5|nr:speriolin-like protein [Colossoma macropomum]
MAEEQNKDPLRVQNEMLQREVDDLRSMLSLMKENMELRTELHSFSSAIESAGTSGAAVSFHNDSDPVRKARLQLLDSVNESKFMSGLLKNTHRTSSPLSLPTEKESPNTTPNPNNQLPDSSFSHQRVEDPERLVGEIAFQLDRRILAYIFQNQSRLYGFTVVNIPDKIIQVRCKSLDGYMDEAYRCELTDRYLDLMDRLRSLGYSLTLHPPFTEFIINTYGILKQRPDTQTARQLGYDNPDLLRRVLVDTVPSGLLKDLLLLFSCLCYMARRDRQALLLW